MIQFEENEEKKNKLQKAIEYIRLLWKFEIRFYLKDFISGIKNLIRWFPIIWKDRDWDDHYIWQIMIQKIKFQAQYIRERDRYTRAKRDAEIMMTCVRLMERVKEEYYLMEYMDYCKDNYKFLEIEGSTSYSLEIEPVWEKFEDYFQKRKTVYRRILKAGGVFGNDTPKHIAMSMSHHNHERARKILFALLERNIEGWWD